MIPSDKESVRLIEQKLGDAKIRQRLTIFVNEKRGNRLIDRFKAFCDWVFKNRETIFQILGIVIMFMDDGKPVLKDVNDVDSNEENKEPVVVATHTPDGEKVEDFLELDEEDEDEDEWFDVADADSWESDDEPEDFDAAFVNTEKRVDALDEMVRTNQETGQYDIGINPLVKDNDEVQPEREGSESTD